MRVVTAGSAANWCVYTYIIYIYISYTCIYIYTSIFTHTHVSSTVIVELSGLSSAPTIENCHGKLCDKLVCIYIYIYYTSLYIHIYMHTCTHTRARVRFTVIVSSTLSSEVPGGNGYGGVCDELVCVSIYYIHLYTSIHTYTQNTHSCTVIAVSSAVSTAVSSAFHSDQTCEN